MEYWKEIFKDMIQEDYYEVKLINGEEYGLIIKFQGKYNREFDSWILEKYLAGLIKPAFFMSNFPFLYVLVCNSVL